MFSFLIHSCRNAVAFACLLIPVIASAAVGRTQGEFSVTPLGALNYRIPIWTPPGTNGMTPHLALQYEQGMGNGILGMGFYVSGLSTISRCNKTLVQEGIPAAPVSAASDAFCMDGKHLRLRTGTGTYGAPESQYRTEIDTFARITAKQSVYSGPAWFRMEGRDGLYYEYGNSTDSRLVRPGWPIVLWALNKVQDRAGNAVAFTYTQDTVNGGFRPNEILYAYAGGTPAAKVKFVYESRPDAVHRFFVEIRTVETQRLDRIDVEHNGSLVRRYDLTYQASAITGRSRLSGVQECATPSDCLSPTSIAWSADAAGWGAENNPGVTIATMANAIAGDMNGDGREDLAYFNTASDSWRI